MGGELQPDLFPSGVDCTSKSSVVGIELSRDSTGTICKRRERAV